jgi:hypothetical protein
MIYQLTLAFKNLALEGSEWYSSCPDNFHFKGNYHGAPQTEKVSGP